MNNKLFLFVVLLFCGFIFSSCNDESEGDFAYFFDSSAKPGKEHGVREMFSLKKYYVITFDKYKSNKEALSSFNALKSSILFANGNGKNIFFTGKYNKETGLFELDHWYIVSPFMVRKFIKVAGSDRTDVRILEKSKLTPDDFYGKITFDPAKYQMRRSAHYTHVYGGVDMKKLDEYEVDKE